MLGFLALAFTVSTPSKSEPTCLMYGGYYDSWYKPVEGTYCWQLAEGKWTCLGPEIDCVFIAQQGSTCTVWYCDVLERPWMCLLGPIPDTLPDPALSR